MCVATCFLCLVFLNALQRSALRERQIQRRVISLASCVSYSDSARSSCCLVSFLEGVIHSAHAAARWCFHAFPHRCRCLEACSSARIRSSVCRRLNRESPMSLTPIFAELGTKHMHVIFDDVTINNGLLSRAISCTVRCN